MKEICVIDYGMGNLTSIMNAIRFLNKDVSLISETEKIRKFDTIVLPGVGAFAKAMEALRKDEMDKAIVESVHGGSKIIGICLGMQLLFTKSFEFGEHAGLNLIEGEVVPFGSQNGLQKTHMGWNDCSPSQNDYKNFSGDYYFVHSYYCAPKDSNASIFTTSYGIDFCSGVALDQHIFGLQFHPEKSQKLGLDLLLHMLDHA